MRPRNAKSDAKTTPTRRAALAGGSAALALGATGAAAMTDAPIVLGQVSLSFYAVTGAVVHGVLERLGHRVEVREGPHEAMFPLLGEGAIDLMAAAWLPEGHAEYWRRYGGEAREVTTLYEGARFFWGVPDYVPQTVSSIADLAKPEVAARFDRTIRGVGSGATISVFSRAALPAYGLEALGFSFVSGTQASWIEAVETAARDRRWMVFPTWAPQYLNRGGRIRPLADPLGVLGGLNRAVLVAPDRRWSRLPERTRTVLERLRLDLDAVTEMDGLVNEGGLSPREAAERWLTDNPGALARWLAA